MTTFKNFAAAAAVAALTCTAAAQQATPPYGTPISLEQAKKVIAAGEAEAQKNNWFVVITVVDTGGYVVATHRLDNTQLGSIPLAEDKARTAVLFRRPSKAFEDAVAGGESDCEFSDCAELLLTTAAFQFSSMASLLVRWASRECFPSRMGRSPMQPPVP